ncbi:porin family protein [Runella rosea]|nr:porin family protein [Runella rosea]
MKTNVLLLALLLVQGVSWAQDGTKFFSLGLRAGANLSQVRGNDLSLGNNASTWQLSDKSNRVWGATGGIFMRIGRTFYVQPEIMFSQKGGQFSLYDGSATTTKSFKMSNIDFPLMFGVKIARFLRINAGPVAAFNIGNSGNLEDAFNDYTNEDTFDDAFRRASLGYQAGIGIDVGKLNFDLRYEGNLTDVVKLKLDNPQAQAQFERKLNLLQATIGFAF